MNQKLNALISEYLNVAIRHQQEGRIDQAIEKYIKIREVDPDNVEMIHLMGTAFYQLGDYLQAERLFEKAITLTQAAPIYCNLGATQQALQKIDESIVSFQHALVLNPSYVEAHYNLAISFKTKGRLADALRSYQAALAISPDYVAAHINMGIVLQDQGKADEALDCYLRAIKIQPDNLEAHNNLGNVHLSKNRLFEAALCFQRSLSIDPGCVQAMNNLAIVYQVQGKLDAAVDQYRQILAIDSGYMQGHSNLIFAMDMRPACNVEELQRERKQWADIHANSLIKDITYKKLRHPGKKLHIGYVSGDFKVHSAYYVFAALMTQFDEDRFEVTAYSNSSVVDEASQVLQKSVTRWKNIVGLTDEEAAEMILEDNVDILVDLSGHSACNRLLIFARKPAPIQITAWGYIGGTGMKAMDYFFADPVVVPPDEKHLYAEEVIYLPNVVCYAPLVPFPPVNALPALFGQGITFGSFNRLAKVSQETFAIWAKVLLAVPNSRMILKTSELDQKSEHQRIFDIFAQHGITPERVILQGKTSWNAHMAAFNQVDISLDPYPHGGGVTTLEGIMMGVPVVTLRWPTLIGRLSAAVLTPLGLTDWIAETPEQYVEIAVNKASDLMALAILRKQLRNTMTNSLVGNPKAYAREVENIYQQLWQRWCAYPANTCGT